MKKEIKCFRVTKNVGGFRNTMADLDSDRYIEYTMDIMKYNIANMYLDSDCILEVRDNISLLRRVKSIDANIFVECDCKIYREYGICIECFHAPVGLIPVRGTKIIAEHLELNLIMDFNKELFKKVYAVWIYCKTLKESVMTILSINSDVLFKFYNGMLWDKIFIFNSWYYLVDFIDVCKFIWYYKGARIQL